MFGGGICPRTTANDSVTISFKSQYNSARA